jgi:hypothetical protein
MKSLILYMHCLMISVSLPAQRNLFSSVWDETSLDSVLVQHWQPFPVYHNRAAWDSLPPEIRLPVIGDAKSLLGKPYDFLPLSEYLGFVRDGNRSRFERIYFGRRSQLLQVLIAECAEGKGMFADDILNGIWTLCEESSWCVPAHIGQPYGVPDPENPVVDLFAAETAALLAYTDYLYGDELNRISPLLRQHLRNEIHTRVLIPFQERDDFWWMGFDGQAVNNWNPWILSNILAACLLVEDDRGRQMRIVAKALRCLDNFTNAYAADGGCDEGPGYWGRAGASLFDCLETLYSASGGRIDYYNNPLIRNIGQYIYKVFISQPWYVNFADASARIEPDAFLIFSYGRRIKDAVMQEFGAQLDAGDTLTVSRRLQSIGRSLPHIFGWRVIRSAAKSWPYLRDAWLPDLQVVTARSMAGSPEGLYFAAKGGHNGESHNHNDVGNFILYYNGQPALIDAGVGAYTAKTFSSERYSIWSMQSQYHNLPTVNGFMQEAGRGYAARDVTYTADEKRVSLGLELAGCYSRGAAIGQWRRNYDFKRGRELTIADHFKLTEVKGTTSWNFLTCLKPEVTESGVIHLRPDEVYLTDRDLVIRYQEKDLEVRIEKIPLAPEDGFVWQLNLYRIVFTPKQMEKEGEIRFSVQVKN